MFELKTVTVDSDQRASLADPTRIFTDDHDRMAQMGLLPLHRTAQAARLAGILDWKEAGTWKLAREEAESEFRSVGRTHLDNETTAMTPVTGTIARRLLSETTDLDSDSEAGTPAEGTRLGVWNMSAMRMLARSMGCATATGRTGEHSQWDMRRFPRWPSADHDSRADAL